MDTGKEIAISIRAPLLPDDQDIFGGPHREEGPIHTLTATMIAPLVKHARSLLWPRYLGVRGKKSLLRQTISLPCIYTTKTF